MLRQRMNLDGVKTQTVLAAVQAKLVKELSPGTIPKKMNPYFDRKKWKAAVVADNISLYPAERPKTEVQKAATLEEKMQINPLIHPVVEWCLAWISRDVAGM